MHLCQNKKQEENISLRFERKIHDGLPFVLMLLRLEVILLLADARVTFAVVFTRT
jgi:hypothetical protein